MNIAVYISGHGFGHLAQVAPVLNRIYQLRPDCRFLIRCSLLHAEIQVRLDFEFESEATPVDVGVVQKNAIEEDCEASIRQLRAWIESMDEQVEREIDLLRNFNPSVVLSDISPLAFPAAKALGVAAIGLATLDWFTIYSHWLAADDPAIERLAEAYGACDVLLTPPMAMHMPVFPERRNISLIAATPADVPNPVAVDRRKKALVLFGGCGNPPFDLQALGNMPDWLFLIPDALENAPENVHSVYSVYVGAGLRAVDLMPFVDVVICKPGYGVLAECWRTATPIAWVKRPDFPEFPMLKRWLDELLPSAGMGRTDFRRGHWLHALEAAHHHSGRFPVLVTDGARQAADIIVSYGQK